jgi:hypothetical protein
MILTPFRYFAYKLLSSKILNNKPNYYRSLLSNETLPSLKQRFKECHLIENIVVRDLSTQHLDVGQTINQVLIKYGRPAFIKSTKSGGIKHDVVLYKRLINGLKSKVVYNFINKDIASVSFNIQVTDESQEKRVNSFIEETYLSNTKATLHPVHCLIDKTGNKLIYETVFDISLTFINNDPEIIQNINAAIYQEKYTNTKYSDSTKFQLTF